MNLGRTVLDEALKLLVVSDVQQARRELLAESREYFAVRLLRQIPSIGPIRAIPLVALIQTPHRFRTKRQFWA
jgi:transposase